MHRPQRRDHRHIAALVVGDPGAASVVGIDALEFEKPRVGLEHGVEVADQQQPLAPRLAFSGGDQMPGATDRVLRHPAHRKAQRGELGRENVVHRLDPRQVPRPAVLVHRLFEQRQGARLLGIDRGNHRSLGGGGRSGKRRGGKERQRGGGKESNAVHARHPSR